MTQVWTLSLSEPWFSHVKAGNKTYEGRLFRGLPRYFKVGDVIEFYHDDGKDLHPIITKIKKIEKFNTFKESLEKLSLPKVLPTIETIDEGEKIYLQYASAQSQIKYGVCQIQIELI